MSKHLRNPVERTVIEPIAKRWSPKTFSDRTVDDETLATLFEGARWTASSFNEQPWRFVLATQRTPEAFERILACVNPSNQPWARRAPVLVLTVAKSHFSHTGNPNRHAWHDVGAAVASLTLEATAHEIFVHQMAGIQAEMAQEACAVPSGYAVVTVLALGYLEETSPAAEPPPRARKPLDDLVFLGTFGSPWLR